MKRYPLSLCALALAAALPGCAEKPQPHVSSNRLYAADQQGKAPDCVASDATVTDGQESKATIATGGGGWCAISVSKEFNPYYSALLTQAPQNGTVYIHAVGDDTRIDYTPKAAPTNDSFTVRLIPGDAVLRISVTPPKPASK